MFFDEIQECPEAITALRYFYEEMPELHVISAGSLLDFTLNRVSVPVGRVSFIILCLDMVMLSKRTKQSVLLLEQAHVIHIVRAPNEERRLRWTISSCTKVFPALLRLNQALLGV